MNQHNIHGPHALRFEKEIVAKADSRAVNNLQTVKMLYSETTTLIPTTLATNIQMINYAKATY